MEEENAFLAFLALLGRRTCADLAVSVATFTGIIRSIRIEVPNTARSADLILHEVVRCASNACRGCLHTAIADNSTLITVIGGVILHCVALAVI